MLRVVLKWLLGRFLEFEFPFLVQRNANNPVYIGGKGGPVNGAARRAVFGELSNFTHKLVQTKVRVFICHHDACALE